MRAIFISVIIIIIICWSVFFFIQKDQETSKELVSSINSSVEDIKEAVSDIQELPSCPTETATGCRKVDHKQVKGCSGEGTVQLSSPMKYEDIGIVIPMGVMVGGHVTPIDHMYFQPIVFHSPPDSYDVVADADGVIVSIGREENFSENKYDKYRMIIYHTCDFYSIYNLITSLSQNISAQVGEIKPGSTKGASIFIKKGELLGRIGGQTLDLSVNYDKVILSGFLEPSSYEGEPWKIHTVDPFDYWESEVKDKLMEKNIRSVPPYGGKIDYDEEGKLVGNWFVENTNGYRGTNSSAYWDTHLSFVYNEIDPSFIIISLGNFAGEAKQFAVKGNSPDPADVQVSKGLVKYELIDFYYTSNGEMWDHMHMAPNLGVSAYDPVKGVLLVQLLESRKVKVEVFPNKTASEVREFTSNAKIYTR